VVESHRQIGRLGLHPESVFPGYAEPYGPNNTALAACVAPRPQLIVGARHDPEFPAASTRAVYEEVREVYRILGAEERLALVLADSGHGYTPPMRRAMYSWANRWLQVEADDQEPDLVLESPEELFCTSGGDVAELGGETVFSLNRACARRLAAERSARRDEALADFSSYRDAIRAGLTGSLLLHRSASALGATEIARARTALDRSETIRIEPEAGFEIVLHVSVPRCARTPCPVVVHCGDEWSIARPALVAALLRAGFAFVAIETRLDADYPALTFGRTGVGMAVTDLMRAIDLLAERPDVDPRRVALYGEGPGSGLVALMAGVLDERVRVVAARDPQRSLAELIDEPDRRSELHLLPGALRHYDVADLCAALGPRPLLLCHPDPDVAWPERCYAALGRPAALRSGYWSREEFDRLLVAWLAALVGGEAPC
jgi:hypothetical protein